MKLQYLLEMFKNSAFSGKKGTTGGPYVSMFNKTPLNNNFCDKYS